MMFEELSWGGFSLGKVQVFIREGHQIDPSCEGLLNQDSLAKSSKRGV